MEVFLSGAGEVADKLRQALVLVLGCFGVQADFCRDAREVHGSAVSTQTVTFALGWLDEELGGLIPIPTHHPAAVGREKA